MFFTLLPYLFWSVLHWTNSGAVVRNPFPQSFETHADSLIRSHLADRLQAHQAKSQPEKCYVHTDRSLYFPGETLWFNAYLREAGSLTPASSSQVLHVSLYAPNGNAVDHRLLYVGDGTSSGSFDLRAEWPGGIYQLKAWTNWMTNTQDTFIRSITLQKTVLPNLNMHLEFEKKAYGPGEEAVARVDFQGLDNQPLAKVSVMFTADAGGEQFTKGTAQTDAWGRVSIKVKLPEKLSSADGLLNVQVVYNGQPEAISRAIPIVLNRVSLQFFPEGGEAVEGLPCRMAFKAVNEFGKAADISGDIESSDGIKVATFTSYHNGMGAFEFVPKAGVRYHATITQPFQSEKPYPLPAAISTGATLRLQQNEEKKLVFQVSSTRKETFYIAGLFRDSMFFYKTIEVSNSIRNIAIPVEKLPPGIVYVTLLNANLEAIAERLVFVNRQKGLQVDIQTDKTKYLPREKVNMNIAVKDSDGRPVPGRFSLAVSDETNLTYADDKQGHILSSLLLEQDVKGKVEEPNFYFDTREPKSGQALDYLLMTQGWRRFVWKDVIDSREMAFAHAAEQDGFTGRIFNINGVPAAFQKIKLMPDGPSTKTDQDGLFSFNGAAAGKYRYLRVGKTDFGITGADQIYWINPAPVIKPTFVSPDNSGATILQGTVTDPDPAVGELIGASIKIWKGTTLVRGALTDINGNFRVFIDPGNYNIEVSYTGYATKRYDGVSVIKGELTVLNIDLPYTTRLMESVNIVAYKVDLVRPDQTSGGQTLTSDQLKQLPSRSINSILATTAGTASIDGGAVTIKGSRSNGTNYYIDGIRVNGSMPPVQMDQIWTRNAPAGSLSNVEVIAYCIPIIRPDQMSTGKTMTSDQIWPSSFKPTDLGINYYETPKYSMRVRTRSYDRAREFYVPQYQPSDTSKYYPTTLYWNPTVETDENGHANVSFVTSDAVSNFRATLEGIGNNGLVAHSEKQFYVQKPINIDVKTPPYVITGDVLRLQMAVTNNTQNEITGTIGIRAPQHFAPVFPAETILTVPAGQTGIFPVAFAIGKENGNQDGQISLQFIAENGIKETFNATIPTFGSGFPVTQVIGSSEPATLFDMALTAPVPGSVFATITAYPSALEDLLKGIERMLQQPGGCFEQVSSSNYPNLLVLDLLKSTGRIQPEVENRARQYLADGYHRLTGYECKSGGFDWFGTPPGHEALTAYGILEFTDMKKVFDVDQQMIDRSVQWLKSRRDGKGGWLCRNGLHAWTKSDEMNAYIVWALSEADYGQDILTEINAAYQKATDSGDLYQIALVANTLLNIKDPRGAMLIDKLIQQQEKDGSWMGKTQSVVCSTGQQLRIETTALAILALLKDGKSVEKAIPFLATTKNQYGYGNTQSTVLALRALVEYAKINQHNTQSGTIIVEVDGKKVKEQSFSKSDARKIEITGLEQFFTNDHPQIKVGFEQKKQAVPYDLELHYMTLLPLNPKGLPFSFQTKMAKKESKSGETVRMTATMTNTSSTALASPVMVLGIPSGLSLQPWQLKQLMDQHQCDYYEIRDGMAVFYFREMEADASKVINLDLRADIPGSYDAPASRAFLYYSNEKQSWDKPERFTVYE